MCKMKLQVLVLFSIVFVFPQSPTSASSFNDFIYSFSPNPICFPQFKRWVLLNTGETRQEFQLQESILQNFCSTKPHNTYLITGDFTEPNICNTMLICNITDCLVIPRKSFMFMYRVARTCKPHIKDNEHNAFFIVDGQLGKPPRYTYLSNEEYRKIAEPLFVLFQNPLFPNNLLNNKLADNLYNSSSKSCEAVSSLLYPNLLLEGLGELPNGCTNISICNDIECYELPLTALGFAYTISRGQFKRSWGLDIPPLCRVEEYNRLSARGVVPIHDDIAASNINRNSSSNADQRAKSGTYGILNFNIPGYRYCGPGTNIEEMDDQGGPMNELDDACREHDIDYLLGTNPEDADAKLLHSVWKLQHPLLPLFMSVFEAKRYFENAVGLNYTSSLYYVPSTFKSSITFYLAETSVYDYAKMDATARDAGRNLENKWKNLLHQIWQGYCYATILGNGNPLTHGSGNDNTPSSNPVCPSSSDATRGHSTPVPIHPSSADEAGPSEPPPTLLPISQSALPVAPAYLKGCAIIISEVAPQQLSQERSFIELRKVCPIGKQNKVKSLEGYLLLILEIGDPSYIVLSVSLTSQTLTEAVEKATGRRTYRSHYFVVGSTGVENCNLLISQISMKAHSADGSDIIPGEMERTYAILLIHIPNTVGDQSQVPLLQMESNQQFYIPTPIDDIRREVIQKYLQDMLVYGAACPMISCGDVMHWLRERPQIVSNDIFIPIPYPIVQQGSPFFLSLNQCSGKPLPMQINDIITAVATPGRRNICPAAGTTDLISLKGKSLQSTAQKVIFNVHQYFLRYSTDRKILQGNAVALTSRVVGLTETTIHQLLTNWNSGSFETPGKARQRPQPVQSQFDGYYSDMIKRIIQGYYAKNVPPFVPIIFSEFMKKVHEIEEVRREKGEVFVPFHCGEQTFRKVLHKLGFRYGNIDMKSVILMRPDIVDRRGKYLYEIRTNRASPNPFPLVFLDETWIDPHARTGKAWVPKNPVSYRESALYSYKRHKVSRGPRIIVLSAGGSDGMIHGATDVFSVSKKDVAGDYHDNVDGKYFIGWFTKLLDELDRTGKKYIIVMDNAPYHGSTDLPKQRDKKDVLYKWLKENLPAEEAGAMAAVGVYRKWELWDMVKQKKSTSNYYRIDRMADQRGHRILRLPPYNCDLNPIELVWKDIKHAVRKQNVDQNLVTVISTARQVLRDYTPEQWQAHINHVTKLEGKYWKDDGFYETFFEAHPKLLITVTAEDDDDDISVEPPYEDVLHSLVLEQEDINNFLIDDDD